MKRQYTALCVVTIGLLLSLSLSQIRAQYVWQTTATAAPTEATITLVGQIIPAVNTGADGGVGYAPTNAHQPNVIKYLEPMEYYLVQDNGEGVKLVFNETISSNQLWQYWAGKWIQAVGQPVRPGLFQVESFGLIPKPALSPTATGPDSSSVLQPLTIKSRQVILLAQNCQGLTTPGVAGPNFAVFGYPVTDPLGQTIPLGVYLAVPFATRVLDRFDHESSFLIPGLYYADWIILRGWIFDPPRKKEYPEMVEVQVARPIAEPQLWSVELTQAPFLSPDLCGASPFRLLSLVWGLVSTPDMRLP